MKSTTPDFTEMSVQPPAPMNAPDDRPDGPRDAAWVRRADRAADALLAALGGALVVIVLAAVFFRYVVNDALVWSDELVRYLFVWFSMLGMAVTLRERQHIRVEYFVERLPPRLRRAVEAAMLAGVGLFLAAAAGLGVAWVWATRGSLTSALQWPLNLFFYASLPGAALLGLWYAARRLRTGAFAERDSAAPGDGRSEGGSEWDS